MASATPPSGPALDTSASSSTDKHTAVELDGSPISPSAPADLPSTKTSSGGSGGGAPTRSSTSGPLEADVEQDGGVALKDRAKAQAKKSKDPAVLVNIPQLPAAQDYEVAALHSETPGGGVGVGSAEGEVVQE
ncbi:MAG: hypothetical protein M1838_000523 [Thelocarpon superellum]|nr:MAG: hypothetical protein M1838_000523 [Thelocarpon superellum]